MVPAFKQTSHLAPVNGKQKLVFTEIIGVCGNGIYSTSMYRIYPAHSEESIAICCLSKRKRRPLHTPGYCLYHFLGFVKWKFLAMMLNYFGWIVRSAALAGIFGKMEILCRICCFNSITLCMVCVAKCIASEIIEPG